MGGPELWKLFEGAPETVKLLVGAVLALGLVMFGLPGYLRKLREPPAPPTDMVLTAGAIADMGPVRDAAKQLGRLADSLERAVGLMVERDERDREREEKERDAEVARLQRLVDDYEARASAPSPSLNRRRRK